MALNINISMQDMHDTTSRRFDYVVLLTVGALVGLGLVMVYSSSFVEAYMLHNTQYYYLVRQSIGALLGVGALLVGSRIHYRFWQHISVPFLAVSLALLLLVLVLPESMTRVNDSRSWIRFGGGLLSMQPSEIAKLALIVYIAHWLSRQSSRLHDWVYGLLPLGVMLGVICGLVMLEPDRGTTLVLLLIAGTIYFAAGAHLTHILATASLSGLAFVALVNLAGAHGRLRAFIDPWQYQDTYGYQPIHALYALGSGGIFGIGLGQSRQKFQWLPQAHTDAIYAILGEELGIIGTLLVVLCFGILAYRGYRIALRAPDMFAALVAVGITSWMFFQAMINIAVTTSLIPFTGITLPFLSYGGTSLIMCMGSIGILLNISRHTVTHQLPGERETPDVSMFQRSPALRAFVEQHTRSIATLLPEWRRHRGPRVPGAGRRRSTRTGRSARTRRTTRRTTSGSG